MDGGGSLLRSVRAADHRDPPRHQRLGQVFQGFLCQTVSSDLAVVLLGALVDLRGGSIAEPIAGSRDLRKVIPLVGLSIVPSEFPESASDDGHGAAGRHVVPGHRRAVLPGLAPGGRILLPRTGTSDRCFGNLPLPGVAPVPVVPPGRPVHQRVLPARWPDGGRPDRKSTRLNSSHQIISYAVFCLKKKNKKKYT